MWHVPTAFAPDTVQGSFFYQYQQSVVGNAFVIKHAIFYNVFLSQLKILIHHYRRKGLFPDSQE